VADLRDGSVAMLENLRFASGEEANDETFARALASCTDVYINDAFAARAILRTLDSRMTRFVFGQRNGVEDGARGEITEPTHGRGRTAVRRSFSAVANLSDKMGLLDSLLDRVDAILFGGPLAHAFLTAQGAASAPPGWKVRSWPGCAPFWPRPKDPM